MYLKSIAIFLQPTENSYPSVINFAEDHSGKIWTASGDGQYGFINVNEPEKGIAQKLELKKKGINETLNMLAADKKGNVWSFTNRMLIQHLHPRYIWLRQFFVTLKGRRVGDCNHVSTAEYHFPGW